LEVGSSKPMNVLLFYLLLEREVLLWYLVATLCVCRDGKSDDKEQLHVLQQPVPSVSLNFHIGKPNAEHCMSEEHSEYSVILVDNKKLSREIKLHIVQLFRTLSTWRQSLFVL
jgi:hypothetical protein